MFSVDFGSPFVILFIAGTIITLLVNNVLEFLDYKSRVRNGAKVPEILRNIPDAVEIFTEEKLSKIVAYENAKFFVWIPESILKTILVLALVFFGFYPQVFNISCYITGEPHSFASLFFCFLIFSFLSDIPESIIDTCFSLYKEFSIEKKFGFSNMTLKLWLIDEIKSFFVSLIPLLFLSLAVTSAFVFFENTWWLILSVVILLFSVIMQVIYPKFIAPVFNKFTPLADGELKQKLEVLLAKTGFKNDGLFVMDASKRSGHSNAYFSGFGKTKRIVLYDTLINQLSSDELVSVLGHELGHFKLKHILKGLLKTIPVLFAGSYFLFVHSRSLSLYKAFGFSVDPENLKWVQFVGLSLVTLIAKSVMEILSPFTNISSRRHEYEADKYSAEICGTSKNLITGLIKLNSENLSELYPPAVYVWWNYSHPTLVQRIQALIKYENGIAEENK